MFELALLDALQSPTSTETPISPPACDSENHAAFDFWLGEWEVYSSSGGSMVADSRIEKKHQGCGVIESWMPLNGRSGTSLNHYDPRSGIWRQKWVGSAPGAVEFTGGLTDGRMILTGNWPNPSAPMPSFA